MSNPLGLVGYGGGDDDDIDDDVDNDVSSNEASEAPSPRKEGDAVADGVQEVETVPSTRQGMMG
jgi:hypothetical protein